LLPGKIPILNPPW